MHIHNDKKLSDIPKKNIYVYMKKSVYVHKEKTNKIESRAKLRDIVVVVVVGLRDFDFSTSEIIHCVTVIEHKGGKIYINYLTTCM